MEQVQIPLLMSHSTYSFSTLLTNLHTNPACSGCLLLFPKSAMCIPDSALACIMHLAWNACHLDYNSYLILPIFRKGAQFSTLQEVLPGKPNTVSLNSFSFSSWIVLLFFLIFIYHKHQFIITYLQIYVSLPWLISWRTEFVTYTAFKILFPHT